MSEETFDVGQLPGRAQELLKAYTSLRNREQSRPRGSLTDFGTDGVDIATVYDDFLDVPAPEDFRPATDALLEAMRQVADDPFATQTTSPDGTEVPDGLANTTLEQVGSAGDELDDWSGLAAEAFKTGYADKFRPVTASQFAVYQVARQAINAEASVWQSVRADLDKFSKNAVEQMKHVNDCKRSDWELLLTLAGAVFTGVGAVKAAGEALDVASAGQSLASTGMDLFSGEGSTDELGLPNGSPAEIIEALVDSLQKIRDEIVVQEDKINDAVTGALALIERQAPDFTLPRPALADATEDDVADRDLMGYAV